MEGGCLVSAKGWEKLGNRRGYQVRLGLFLIMSEEEDAGERLLDAYLADRDVSGAQERACALLGKAYCLIIADKREEAGKRLSALRTGSRYRSTDEGKIAAYLQGCMLSQDKQSMKDAVTIFGDLANDKNFSLAPKALLALAQAQANGGDWKGAMQSADALRKKFGKTVYGDAGKTLHAAVRTIKENDKGIGPLESGSGDVVLHRRTVVVPSSSVWELYSDKFRPGDWVLYDLTFVSRDPCSVIRGIQVGLEPMEPQPQRAKGNRLVFVRSPLLHMSGLRQLDPRSPEARGRGADGEDSATQ
jgi:hypothetical protein